MEVTKTIVINVEKTKSSLIVNDLATLSLLMGTTAVSGNLSYYGIKKEKNRFVIPLKIIKSRRELLKSRIDKMMSTLEIIDQVLSKK